MKKISALIKVLNGGIEFYQEGVEKIKEANLKALFGQMIEEKQEAVASLQGFAVAEQGHTETQNDFGVEIRSMYTKLLGNFTSDMAHTYIEQLEEVEDKVLQSIDDALEVKQPTRCATELRRIRTRMQQCHDQMKWFKTESEKRRLSPALSRTS
ncbi:PA2169 family four-helix-bundle protein [Alteromonas ponticola]|uniref:PA2169 family four-helix-bundle protein n=1 Tax=Alteromonas ponticola TaxID=2720613 RepID=UPI0031B61272